MSDLVTVRIRYVGRERTEAFVDDPNGSGKLILAEVICEPGSYIGEGDLSPQLQFDLPGLVSLFTEVGIDNDRQEPETEAEGTGITAAKRKLLPEDLRVLKGWIVSLGADLLTEHVEVWDSLHDAFLESGGDLFPGERNFLSLLISNSLPIAMRIGEHELRYNSQAKRFVFTGPSLWEIEELLAWVLWILSDDLLRQTKGVQDSYSPFLVTPLRKLRPEIPSDLQDRFSADSSDSKEAKNPSTGGKVVPDESHANEDSPPVPEPTESAGSAGVEEAGTQANEQLPTEKTVLNRVIEAGERARAKSGELANGIPAAREGLQQLISDNDLGK